MANTTITKLPDAKAEWTAGSWGAWRFGYAGGEVRVQENNCITAFQTKPTVESVVFAAASIKITLTTETSATAALRCRIYNQDPRESGLENAIGEQVLTGISINETYEFSFRGVNASGKYITEFAATGVSATMTNQEEQLDASSPALQGATATANGIQVTWKANSGVLKYQVFRKVAGGKWIKLGITTGSGNESVKATEGSICSFVDGAAEAGVNYVYTVRGVDESGNYVTSFNSKGVSCKK